MHLESTVNDNKEDRIFQSLCQVEFKGVKVLTKYRAGTRHNSNKKKFLHVSQVKKIFTDKASWPREEESALCQTSPHHQASLQSEILREESVSDVCSSKSPEPGRTSGEIQRLGAVRSVLDLTGLTVRPPHTSSTPKESVLCTCELRLDLEDSLRENLIPDQVNNLRQQVTKFQRRLMIFILVVVETKAL